jgi:hypothetical protein
VVRQIKRIPAMQHMRQLRWFRQALAIAHCCFVAMGAGGGYNMPKPHNHG